MLDAYAIRKAVPRILIAAIGVNLSIYLCVAAIDLTNVVGNGLGDLLTYPFVNNDAWHRVSVENNGTNALGIAFILSLVGGVGFWSIFSGAIVLALPMLVAFMVSAALVMLAILFTLALRQALLIFCVVISPIAIALFVLPGTEKYFKKWVDLFVSTLMVYPIIAVLFAMSTVMTTILLGTADLSPGAIGLTKILSAMVVAFAPLVMIPFAFKLAGGAISAIMNAGQGSANTLSGSARKAMANKVNDPDSIFGQYRHNRRSAVSDRGLTARQLWAKRLGGEDRAGRIQEAKSLDEAILKSSLSETARYKKDAVNSAAMRSLTMTKEEVTDERNRLQEEIASGALTGSALNEARATLQGHAKADQIGRTSASARAAYTNPDRIKYIPESGEEGYNQQREVARRIFGEEGMADAMNEFQYIAKGAAGRADLAGGVNGNDYSVDKAFGSQSNYTLMNNGTAKSIEALIDENTKIAKNVFKPREERLKAVGRLHSLKNYKGSGKDENLQAVLSKSADIDSAMSSFMATEVRRKANDAPKTKSKVVQRTAPDPRRTGQTITSTETVTSPATPADMTEWAQRELIKEINDNSLGFNQPDQSERQ